MTLTTPAPAAGSRTRVLGRALVAAAIMAVGLGTAGAAGILVRDLFGAGERVQQAVTALSCGLVVVPLLVLLRRRIDRRSVASLGLPRRHAARRFALGVLVTGGSAVLMLGMGAAIGWIRIGPAQLPTLLGFLAFNTVAALALEAVPEELTLRGYAYRTLATRVHRWIAAVGTTALFLVVPAASNVVRETVLFVFGRPFGSITFAPGGGDPITYGILLVLFGGTLIVTRVATGSLWPCIALHLTFLTVNRFVFDAEGRNTGWLIEATLNAQLLVPGYLLLTTLTFLVLARVSGRRIGWREREPDHERVPEPATP